MNKILIDFTKLTDAAFDVLAQKIIVCMTGNPNFPKPDPDLATISAAIDDFAKTLHNLDGSFEKTELKNQKRAALVKLLRKLGNWVGDHSNDDNAIKLSSGFDIAKGRTKRGPLTKPALTVNAGKKTANLSCEPVPGAQAYSWEYTEAPVAETSIWSTAHSSKSVTKINNLVTGKEYAFRVAGIGTDPQVTYSDVVLSYIL